MDELELLLEGLREEQPPAEALERVGPRVRAALLRRRVTQFVLAAAALVGMTIWMMPGEMEPVPLPEPVKAIIAVPDLILTVPAPVTLSSHRAKQRARVVDENTLQLASSDPNVVIYWSLE
jgi:hypothetical protein